VSALAYDAIILAGGRASRLGGAQKADVEIGGRALLDIALEAAAGAVRIVVVGPDELRRDGREAGAASVRFVREDPPLGGPVAGLAAGLAALDQPGATDAAGAVFRDDHVATSSTTGGDDRSRDDRAATSPTSEPDGAEWLLVLACDLPYAPQAVQRLTAAAVELAVAHADAVAEAVAEADADADPDAGTRPDGVCLVDADGRAQWLAGIYRRASLSRGVDGLGGVVQGASVRRLVGGLELRHISDGGTALDVDTWQDVEQARRRIEGDSVTDAQTPDARTQSERSDASGEQGDTAARVPPARLEPWLAALAEALELDSAEVPIRTVLDAARDIAHGVARPAAPLSTFLIGLAAAQRGGDEAAIDEACRIAAELAQGWRDNDEAH
jgi:molybdopterin-guanine dinucleotide biosynthesis protein A